MKRDILFVDDEPYILQGLQRMLRPMRNEWEMKFVNSGQQALKAMQEKSFDVIVTDMLMPGMDGAELLTRVMQNDADIVRIVLSGHSDQELVVRSIGPAHQYLSKPCNAQTLKNVVARACRLRSSLANKDLKRLVGEMENLPSLPNLYLELVEELQSSESSLQKVGELISKDVAMAAKILQLVNSAFFGLRREVSNPMHAASLLGLDTIKALVLTVQVFSQFEEDGLGGLSMELLWKHSSIVGSCARIIALAQSKDKRVPDDSLMAGMLHDVGKLILAANLSDVYRELVKYAGAQGVPLWEAEQQDLGTTHAEVGAYLLGIWGIPDPIVEAIAYHHRPTDSLNCNFSALTAVHVANYFAHKQQTRCKQRPIANLESDYLSKTGLSEVILKWRELCRNQFEEVKGQ